MTNLYIFWSKIEDPPASWTRLTRTNKYLRCSDDTADHLSDAGTSTHLHTVSGFTCGYCNTGVTENYGSGQYGHAYHSHSTPTSWTIASENNTPPGYGLDIIYIDLEVFEQLASFPDGSIILSNGVLVDASLTRFSSADGKYIVHSEPGTTVGSSSSHSHSVAGTTAANADSSGVRWTGSDLMAATSHTHLISLTSTSTTPEPKNIVTRLYEVLTKTSSAISGTVVFVDGEVTDLWEILGTWDGANIKSGDSDPTVSGTDTHTHTFSGNSGNNSAGSNSVASHFPGSYSIPLHPHIHSVSGTLASTNHIPASKLLTPARLLTTIYPRMRNKAQIVGLTAW